MRQTNWPSTEPDKHTSRNLKRKASTCILQQTASTSHPHRIAIDVCRLRDRERHVNNVGLCECVCVHIRWNNPADISFMWWRRATAIETLNADTQTRSIARLGRTATTWRQLGTPNRTKTSSPLVRFTHSNRWRIRLPSDRARLIPIDMRCRLSVHSVHILNNNRIVYSDIILRL